MLRSGLSQDVGASMTEMLQVRHGRQQRFSLLTSTALQIHAGSSNLLQMMHQAYNEHSAELLVSSAIDAKLISSTMAQHVIHNGCSPRQMYSFPGRQQLERQALGQNQPRQAIHQADDPELISRRTWQQAQRRCRPAQRPVHRVFDKHCPSCMTSSNSSIFTAGLLDRWVSDMAILGTPLGLSCRITPFHRT